MKKPARISKGISGKFSEVLMVYFRKFPMSLINYGTLTMESLEKFLKDRMEDFLKSKSWEYFFQNSLSHFLEVFPETLSDFFNFKEYLKESLKEFQELTGRPGIHEQPLKHFQKDFIKD